MHDDEEAQLRSVLVQNAQSIFQARQRAQQELIEIKDALEAKTRELAHSLSMIRATLESTTDGILVTDENGTITGFNQKFVDMWQIPEAIMDLRTHSKIQELICQQVANARLYYLKVNAIYQYAPPESFDLLELADGRVYERYTRIQEVANRAVGRVWSFRDITERAQTEIALREAKEEAEAANRAKSEFLAVMSHELRTPLNAISGYASIMEMGIHGPLTEEQREDLRRIQSSQQHLLGLIDEVLNHAKSETGTVQYHLSDVRARDAIAEAEKLVEPQVLAKQLTLSVSECVDLTVRADPEKLRQILLNLLSNAVKFTDHGGRIDLACAPAETKVQFMVRDSGTGIPEDMLDAIFEPFVQVRSDRARIAQGTGLGLAISRDFARAMGGDLTVESELGVGSAFTLVLPAA